MRLGSGGEQLIGGSTKAGDVSGVFGAHLASLRFVFTDCGLLLAVQSTRLIMTS